MLLAVFSKTDFTFTFVLLKDNKAYIYDGIYAIIIIIMTTHLNRLGNIIRAIASNTVARLKNDLSSR